MRLSLLRFSLPISPPRRPLTRQVPGFARLCSKTPRVDSPSHDSPLAFCLLFCPGCAFSKPGGPAPPGSPCQAGRAGPGTPEAAEADQRRKNSAARSLGFGPLNGKGVISTASLLPILRALFTERRSSRGDRAACPTGCRCGCRTSSERWCRWSCRRRTSAHRPCSGTRRWGK